MTSGEGRLRNLNRIVEQVSKEKGLDRSIVVSALEEAAVGGGDELLAKLPSEKLGGEGACRT